MCVLFSTAIIYNLCIMIIPSLVIILYTYTLTYLTYFNSNYSLGYTVISDKVIADDLLISQLFSF